jgi:hypothetical protein
MSDASEASALAQRQLLQATMRVNATVFGVLLGFMAGLLLFVLALVARPGGPSGLFVSLLAVFLPGYASGWLGALPGLFWGWIVGALLGGGIYWISYRNLGSEIDHLVAATPAGDDPPRAILRLHGPSLGLAIGIMGAIGLVTTTTWLVVRGTAPQSVHAGLLAEILPGYTVSVAGSLVGALELFLILYLVCMGFAFIYNRIVAAGPRRR